MNDAGLTLELRRLAAAVEAQADQLAELQRCLLDKADRRTGMRLVPALAKVTQGRPFDAASVAALALNAPGPAAETVRQHITDMADADAGLRGFGRLLHRLRGVRFAELRLEPVAGGRWRVVGFDAE